MPNRRETTITNELVNILRNMRHGWELETEVNAFIKGNSELDALVIERGREPIGIEAKFATTTNAKNLIKQAETRLVYELEAEYHTATKTLNNVMAILYPDRFKTMPGRDINPQLREADDLQYKLISTLRGTVGHFPENGWATGTVGDIANALHVGAIPNSQLEQAAQDLEYSIDSAAHLLEDAIADHRAIGTKIETILHQEVFSKDSVSVGAISESRHLNLQTLRMAALIITDAFVFQSSLAGKAEMESVRSLRQLLPTIDYADVIADWNTILKVNYRPIFEDARYLVEALATDDRLVKPVLTLLCEAARDLVDTGIAQIHELAGIVFQKLITDRKYVKANYTLPESAVLLSTLVLPKLPEGKLPKVADFACGTGALLNGVYQRILSLYEQQGGNGKDIHQKMLEENIGGADIMPNATHLTAAALASTYAELKIRGTRIITAPYGKQDNGTYAIGALDWLDNTPVFKGMDTQAQQLGGTESVAVETQHVFKHGEFDIIIQNPPFTKPGTDQGSGVPKTTFQGSDRPEEDKKAMQAALRNKDSRVAHGLSGLVSYFVDLADRKLKHEGTIAYTLPATLQTSSPMQKVRDMLATEYQKVVVITIAEAKSEDAAFSADTNMTECIVVAKKGVGSDTGRGKFVCLNQRPQSALEAVEIANYINQNSSTRRLEDPPNGGDIIRIGDDIVGQMLNCPLLLGEGWEVSRVQSMALIQSAYRIQKGILHLPMQTTNVNVPMCRVEDIGQVGWHPESVYGRDGPFDMVKGDANSDGYPCLWSLNSETQRSMLVNPDSRGIPRRNTEDILSKILTKNSRAHYNLYLRFNANSTLVLLTENPSVGVNRIPNVAFENPRHETAFVLWCNSTLGLMCHWIHSGKQQSGRGILTLKTLATTPTLDVRALSEEALSNAESVFERLKHKRMLPVNECAHDPVRHELDTNLLTEVLGIKDIGVLASMQTLREMLCAEPSIHGGKKSKCDLDAELAKLKLKGIAFPSWYGD
ncbi:hypothetical protein F4055_11150 [Candidatus Poribacteria bacterium]|nr:hypothetical protein [Candidatus Poribacteria bacterium]